VNKISEYITYVEATKSVTAIKNNIDNTPNEDELKSMQAVGVNVFDKVRTHFNTHVGISSFFRCVALNKKVGGAKASEHCLGKAIDIDADIYGKLTNKQIFDYIKDNLEYHKLIWEFGNDKSPDWVHVSYDEGNNKKINLKAVKVKGKTSYIPYK